MVTRPPDRRGGCRDPQLPGEWPDHIQRVNVRIDPVLLAEVRRGRGFLWVESTPFLILREHPAGDRAEIVKGDGVVAQALQQLRLDRALDRVVETLVDIRLLPAVTLAKFADLRDLPRRVVADAEPPEVARLVELVDRL